MTPGNDRAALRGFLNAWKAQLSGLLDLKKVYFKNNRERASRVLAAGPRHITEIWPGTFPGPQNFSFGTGHPRQYRRVLVTESGKSTSPQVMAGCIWEQGRDAYLGATSRLSSRRNLTH